MRTIHTLAVAGIAVAGLAAVAAIAQDLGVYGALHVKSGGPIYECLPGAAVFWDQVPDNVRTREKCEKTSRSSNEVAKVEGSLAIDMSAPDPTGLTKSDPPTVMCKFKRKDGSEWQFLPNADSMVDRGPVGSSSSKFAFGSSTKGTPLEPKQRYCLRMRGKGRLMSGGKQVGSDVMYNLVVGSQTRDPETGKLLDGYETLHDSGMPEAKLVVDEWQEIPGNGKGLAIVFTKVSVRE